MQKNHFSCIFLSLLLCATLCACSGSSIKTTPLSEEQIAEQRAKLPYSTMNPLVDVSVPEHFTDVKKSYQTALGVAVVTVTDDLMIQKKSLSPAEGLPVTVINELMLPVHIESVIAQKSGASFGGDVVLFLGSQEINSGLNDLPKGTKLLLPIYSPMEGVTFEGYPDYYGGSVEIGYYITADNHLLSIYDISGINEMNGVSLASFQTQLDGLYQ